MSGAVTQQNKVAPPSEQTPWINPDGSPTEYFFRYIGQLARQVDGQGVILEDLYNQVNP